MSQEKTVFVGVDVGKYHFDVALGSEGEVRRLKNDDEGIDATVRWLKDHPVALVVMEASGGYQRQLLATLLAEGIPAVAMHANQTRSFAKATGRLEKTDTLDARVLALFGERMRPPVRVLPDETLQRLAEWLTRRRQMVEMLTAERNRHQQAKGEIRKNIEAHISWLRKQLRETEKDLSNRMKDCPAWNAVIELLDKQPGLGRVAAMTLVAVVPELGTLNRKQIAKLVGVAPLSRDSGLYRGRRAVWGGRSAARSCLYMVTLVATRHHPDIRAFYQRLLAANKPKLLALTASMRKFLTILNAIVRKHRLENPVPDPA